MFNSCGKLILLKAPLCKNSTFQINLKNAEIQCLKATIIDEGNWLWHSRLGHLNFKSLKQLGAKQMVVGIPITKIPEKVYEVCVAGKQSRKAFKLCLPMRVGAALEVVHLDICGPFEVPPFGR